jgi:hypothetical protein
MRKQKGLMKLLVVILMLTLFDLSCQKSVEPSETTSLDLSKITETDSSGKFIGSIDTTDWDRSYYSCIRFYNSFWVGKSCYGDTLFYSARNIGEEDFSDFSVFNDGGTDLTITTTLLSPFRTKYFPTVVPAKHKYNARITFTLPDTVTDVYINRAVLHCSNADSIVFLLKAVRIPSSGERFSGYLPFVSGLMPAFPNPSSGLITFAFITPQTGQTKLTIVDDKERVVAILIDSIYSRGFYKISWPAEVDNGYYRAVFQTGNYYSKGDFFIQR